MLVGPPSMSCSKDRERCSAFTLVSGGKHVQERLPGLQHPSPVLLHLTQVWNQPGCLVGIKKPRAFIKIEKLVDPDAIHLYAISGVQFREARQPIHCLLILYVKTHMASPAISSTSRMSFTLIFLTFSLNRVEPTALAKKLATLRAMFHPETTY